MVMWETDDEHPSGPAAVSLPTPKSTPYRTPSHSSRKKRRSITPPGRGKTTNNVLFERTDKRTSKDITTDETISILDPRRFTPTLHANLVSEILTLRRDQDDKLRLIDSLENNLQTAKEDGDIGQESLTSTSKENRSLKRQLALLEGGTSSALGELARERDEAVDSAADTKKRLEEALKKLRAQHTDSKRVHDSWAQEKTDWEDERRKFERRIHIAETRLQTVLEEVTAFQAAQADNTYDATINDHHSEGEESSKDIDAGSMHSPSRPNSIRFSTLSGHSQIKTNGHSLADELNFVDDEDEDDGPAGRDGRVSSMSHRASFRHLRNVSRDSIGSRVHLRNQSIESLKHPGVVARSRLFMNQSVLEKLEGEDEQDEEVKPLARSVSYTDTGVQFTPPPSPTIGASDSKTVELLTTRPSSSESGCSSRLDPDVEANQGRKRVQVTSTLPEVFSETAQRISLRSIACQTLDEAPSRAAAAAAAIELPMIQLPKTATTATQTDAMVLRSAATPSPPPLPVPSINIQPPTSRPTTPKEARLPQHFKHFGCQVNIVDSPHMDDVGTQTEGIQVDKRLALLPPHLQPSAISSRPGSPKALTAFDSAKSFTPLPGNLPPRNPRRLNNKQDTRDPPSSPIESLYEDSLSELYTRNNDNGPLSHSKKAPATRPHRFSSLFAGFDTASSDDGDEFGDHDFSDSEFRTALSAPRPLSPSSRGGKRSSIGTVPTSPEEQAPRKLAPASANTSGIDVHSSFSLLEKESWAGKRSSRGYEKSTVSSSMHQANKASMMRKAAMIQSGIFTHQGRVRSPSLPETQDPPFPIPTRASSKFPSTTASLSAEGQRSPTRGYRPQPRGPLRTNSIRKVRSATALPRPRRQRRHGSRSPPPLSPSTEAPESPGLPPLPMNDLTTPRNAGRNQSNYRKHRYEASTNTEVTHTMDPVSLNSVSQTTGVVDAIAQTMVGEWMFKYVRRRKSFGVPEAGGKDDNSNDRHKRWVWIAPYERAILWSSKQPSSGTALMGKVGRKLSIQSVLDVKDDNPAPKGSGPMFNRSILILTPQRALKFTAPSAERHYIWLTALSFLAHSQQAIPELPVAPVPTVPTKKQPVLEIEEPRPKSKRPGIRDSIRLAKGRTGIGHDKSIPPSVPSVPSIASGRSHPGDVGASPVTDSFGIITSSHIRDDSKDIAEAPYIPRFHDRANMGSNHGRKRSNTGGHVPPPLSFRGFSGPTGIISQHIPSKSAAGNSVTTAASSELHQSQGSTGNAIWETSQTASGRTSDVSAALSSNFFDAIGTVRMEAFISPLGQPPLTDDLDEHAEMNFLVRKRSKELRRQNSRNRHYRRDSYNPSWSRGVDEYSLSVNTPSERDFFREDPFKGF